MLLLLYYILKGDDNFDHFKLAHTEKWHKKDRGCQGQEHHHQLTKGQKLLLQK